VIFPEVELAARSIGANYSDATVEVERLTAVNENITTQLKTAQGVVDAQRVSLNEALAEIDRLGEEVFLSSQTLAERDELTVHVCICTLL